MIWRCGTVAGMPNYQLPSSPPDSLKPTGVLALCTVRAAKLSEAEQITEMAGAAVRSTFPLQIYSPVEQTIWYESVTGEAGLTTIRAHIASGTATICLFSDGGAAPVRIAGYIGMHPWKASVQSLYVAPEYHGMGVGRRLLAEQVLSLRMRREPVLAVVASLPAIEFYRKLGFECSTPGPEVHVDQFGREVRWQPMEKRIS
jgi:ribosomal protein S18 acetylase RimI-like enzyme